MQGRVFSPFAQITQLFLDHPDEEVQDPVGEVGHQDVFWFHLDSWGLAARATASRCCSYGYLIGSGSRILSVNLRHQAALELELLYQALQLARIAA